MPISNGIWTADLLFFLWSEVRSIEDRKPLSTVKLLGVTLDSHLTLASHVDTAIRKAHGLLGALARAAPCLPRSLLKQAYVALIRTHLEYCSAILTPVAKTHLKKLDVIQRSAACIIFGLPRDAHAAPLLEALQLQSLESRRQDHVVKIVSFILDGEYHPAFNKFFTAGLDGRIESTYAPRTAFGRKRFTCTGANAYNASISSESSSQMNDQ